MGGFVTFFGTSRIERVGENLSDETMDVFKEMFWVDTEGNFLNVINWAKP